MDGTLLNSKSQVSNEFFELFNALQSHKIHFVAASGRQYTSIHEKLELISEQITIVAENGGYIRQGSKELGSIHLSADRVRKLLPVLKASEGLYYVVCGKKSAYIDQNEIHFTRILKEYYTRYTVVEDLMSLPDDQIFKVAVYHFDSSERFIYPVVKHLENSYQIKISGSNWVDISDPGANKGRAVKLLQDKLGISKDETMVFGDFNNDLEMIDQAFYSYAMENAHDNVKKAAKFMTKSNNDSGVEFILKELIEAKERSLG